MSGTTSAPKGASPSVRKLQRSRSDIYPFPGGVLFVPTADMWRLHEVGKPTAILGHLGLAHMALSQWEKRFDRDRQWLRKWLYSGRRLPPAVANGFQPTPGMEDFRREATITAILARAFRPRERITDSLVSFWKQRFKKYDWFEGWLLRGENPPDGVRIATIQEVDRCARAWDYAAFCQRAKIDCGSYVLWISRDKIPSLAWLKWLFGAPPPPGAFVVVRELQHLRREMGRKGILRAAGLSTATIWYWERSPRTSRHIEVALTGKSAAGVDGWSELTNQTRRHLETVGRLAGLDACCDRAGLSVSQYRNLMGEADRCGVKENLLRYLKSQGADGSNGTGKCRQSGLVADEFFVPTADMLDFREEALREGVKQKIWPLLNMPGRSGWFRDWTAPKAHRGRRHLVPLFDGAAPSTATGLVSERLESPGGTESGSRRDPEVRPSLWSDGLSVQEWAKVFGCYRHKAREILTDRLDDGSAEKETRQRWRVQLSSLQPDERSRYNAIVRKRLDAIAAEA